MIFIRRQIEYFKKIKKKEEEEKAKSFHVIFNEHQTIFTNLVYFLVYFLDSYRICIEKVLAFIIVFMENNS